MSKSEARYQNVGDKYIPEVVEMKELDMMMVIQQKGREW